MGASTTSGGGSTRKSMSLYPQPGHFILFLEDTSASPFFRISKEKPPQPDAGRRGKVGPYVVFQMVRAVSHDTVGLPRSRALRYAISSVRQVFPK